MISLGLASDEKTLTPEGERFKALVESGFINKDGSLAENGEAFVTPTEDIPNENDFMSQKFWFYEDSNYSTEKSSILIEFENEKIYSVTYTSNRSDYDTPEIMGFKQGSNYEEIIKKLGDPSFIATSKDGLERVLYYDNWNAYFVLGKARVTIYGIYDSTKGRPDWAKD